MLGELLCTKRRQLDRQAHSHSRRYEDAEDALSDACVQFLRFYDGPEGRDALRWMLVVVKRCAWELARSSRASDFRLKSRRIGDLEDPAALVREERSGPDELLERAEEATHVTGLIARLKPDEREALILLGLGYSYMEIAELRGWSKRKVNRCLTEGRATVRELMEGGVKS